MDSARCILVAEDDADDVSSRFTIVPLLFFRVFNVAVYELLLRIAASWESIQRYSIFSSH